MNKSFYKKSEEASRKHEKKGGANKHSFMEGVNFCNNNSPKQFDEKEMFQTLYDGVGHFAQKNDIKINNKELLNWFKNHIKINKK